MPKRKSFPVYGNTPLLFLVVFTFPELHQLNTNTSFKSACTKLKFYLSGKSNHGCFANKIFIEGQRLFGFLQGYNRNTITTLYNIFPFYF